VHQPDVLEVLQLYSEDLTGFLVEDNGEIRKLLFELLVGQGYIVNEAERFKAGFRVGLINATTEKPSPNKQKMFKRGGLRADHVKILNYKKINCKANY